MVQLSTDSIRNYLKSRRICREGEIPLNPPFRKGEAAVWLGFEIVTKLTIVRRASIAPADGTFDLMEDGIQIIEDFIGVTWPNGDVLLLAEPELELAQDDPPLGFFSHSHMVIDLPERHENFPRVLYHELAHFYLNGGNMPIRLSESGSEFVRFYVLEQTSQATLGSHKSRVMEEILKGCTPHDIGNVQDLVDATDGLSYSEAKALPSWLCHYEIGEYLLLRLYETFGRDSIANALRDLYLLAAAERRVVTEQEIYNAFLAHVPPGQEQQFREIYRELHGSPFSHP